MTQPSAGRYLWPAMRSVLSGGYIPDRGTKFVIVYLPRTGSNRLAALLDSHPDVLCHHEVFNPDGIHRSLAYKQSDLSFGTVAERDADPWRFIRRVYEFTDGATAVGFKLGPGRPYNPVLATLMLARRVRKIVVERRNLLHAYTSVLIARATQVWSRTDPASGGAHRSQVRVTVDLPGFRRFVRKRQFFYAVARTQLRGTGQPHRFVAYEDLDDPAVRTDLLAFLGVDPQTGLTDGTVRQNPPLVRPRVENYDEIARALEGTSLAHMLDPT
jgi:hypothetical protein